MTTPETGYEVLPDAIVTFVPALDPAHDPLMAPPGGRYRSVGLAAGSDAGRLGERRTLLGIASRGPAR